MLKNTILTFKVCTLTLLISTNISANTENFKDMVYIAAPSPFYIKIFETSFFDIKNKEGDSKPARMSFNEAKSYCQSIGLKLPTMSQWLMAATNLNKNIHYSLINDKLEDDQGNLQVNIQRYLGGSSFTKKFSKIGIDAAGTVAMTGNRPEWVLGPLGTEYKCGGAYETEDPNNVHLTRICKSKADGYATDSGTARCVLAFDSAIDITFSNSISGELKTYLENINYGFNNKLIESTASMSTAGQGSLRYTMDNLDLDDNEEDFN